MVKRLCVREAREWDSSDLKLFSLLFSFKKWANPAPTRATESKAPPHGRQKEMRGEGSGGGGG